MADITLIRKTPCSFSDRAQALLDEKKIPYDLLDLTDKPDELETWKKKLGSSTVPMILMNNKLIGGYTDLRSFDDNGQLSP